MLGNIDEVNIDEVNIDECVTSVIGPNSGEIHIGIFTPLDDLTSVIVDP